MKAALFNKLCLGFCEAQDLFLNCVDIDFDAGVIIAFICSLYFVRLSTLQQLLMIDTLEACKNCQTQA